jgi:two-component system sensor kinase FixL
VISTSGKQSAIGRNMVRRRKPVRELEKSEERYQLVEEELAKSDLRFRSLMEQSPLAIEMLSPDGRITQVNSAWMRLWNVDEEETAQVVAEYNMLTDEQAIDLGVGPLIRKAFGGEPVVLPPIQYSPNRTARDLGLELAEGRTRWIQCHLFPVKDANQEVPFVVNTYVDITELKMKEEESRRQREVLARVDRATRMGQLTGSIAHELNQPLTGILSNAQAAELMIGSGVWGQDELEEILAEIVADAKRGGDVIRNLRELYREQKGEFKPVDINVVVEETMRLLYSESVKHQIEYTTRYAPSLPMVNGNQVQIQQVLVNLIVNGNQAMLASERDDRRLRIATASHANEVRAWVEDNGPGIDADNIDRIFEPLATWKPGGTGMGLALSHTIVEAHGGRMWAENRSQGGARVGFALPVLKMDPRT